MLLQKESNPGLNTITAYGAGYVEINGQPYHHSLRFGPEGPVEAWPVQDASQLTLAALREIAGIAEVAADPMAFLDDAPPVATTDTEIVLIGTGSRQSLLPQSITAPLLRLGIGVEAMSTPAAARTYNILMSEGRRVVVALIPPQDAE
ncbi:MAG: Xcc1710-like domain-containing protein [Alcaligenaceae bacterium]|nr:Xcc1710-like domain-containing protein [Alcaligenaceae bacterium]